MKRAFALVKRVTGTDEWDAIARRCTEDLLVYLAHGRFRRRPPMTALPLRLQRDIRVFFGRYTKACRQAEFEADPHPALVRSVKLSLRTRESECFDYAGAANPPILHRKETFLTAEHPLHARFARLTAQEETHGLLDDPATIGTREGWQARLNAAGLALRGHRLVRRER